MHPSRGDYWFALRLNKHIRVLLSSPTHVKRCFDPTLQSAFHLKIIKVLILWLSTIICVSHRGKLRHLETR